MQSDNATWPIPHGLSPLGVRAAEVIRSFLHDRGIQDHGGGGRFYTPEEWVDRGELYGRTSLLLVTHDRRMLDTVRTDRRWQVQDGRVTER